MSTIEIDKEYLEDSYVCLDIETTGLSLTKGATIIEIGAVKIVNGKMVDKFSELIYPDCKIPKKIVEITGITDAMVVGKRLLGHVLKDFYEFIGDFPVVGHNMKFDWDRFLVPSFKKIGKAANNKSIDTLAISKIVNKELKSHRLNILADKYNIEFNHHRAYDDAFVTARIYGLMKQTVKGVFNPNSKYSTQSSLFEDVKGGPTLEEISKEPVRISSIKYWERPKTKNNYMKRIYLNVKQGVLMGSVYFDVVSGIWYVKDFPGTIDFDKLEVEALKVTKSANLNEFKSYRN